MLTAALLTSQKAQTIEQMNERNVVYRYSKHYSALKRKEF